MTAENIRLLARLDIKNQTVVKPIQLEGLRVVGEPKEMARAYYKAGIDGLIYMDIVASLYNRNSLVEYVRYTAENMFIPLTVGGGIRSVNDVETLLENGADSVAINTAAIKSPQLLCDVANQFGSQCLVLSVEAKKNSKNNWEAYYDCGREKSGKNVLDWVKQAEELGVGEILLTSVDQEGTKQGFDLELITAVTSTVSIPVIASGGFKQPSDFVSAVKEGGSNAVAVADALHYKKYTVAEIKNHAMQSAILVRTL